MSSLPVNHGLIKTVPAEQLESWQLSSDTLPIRSAQGKSSSLQHKLAECAVCSPKHLLSLVGTHSAEPHCQPPLKLDGEHGQTRCMSLPTWPIQTSHTILLSSCLPLPAKCRRSSKVVWCPRRRSHKMEGTWASEKPQRISHWPETII